MQACYSFYEADERGIHRIAKYGLLSLACWVAVAILVALKSGFKVWFLFTWVLLGSLCAATLLHTLPRFRVRATMEDLIIEYGLLGLARFRVHRDTIKEIGQMKDESTVDRWRIMRYARDYKRSRVFFGSDSNEVIYIRLPDRLLIFNCRNANRLARELRAHCRIAEGPMLALSDLAKGNAES